MSVAQQIEQLQDYPQKASDEFREQLQRARKARDQLDSGTNGGRGMDRSGELVPMSRPRIVRTLVGK